MAESQPPEDDVRYVPSHAYDSDDEEFLRGVEVGALEAKILGTSAVSAVMRRSNEEMVRRIAEAAGRGYTTEAPTDPFEPWLSAGTALGQCVLDGRTGDGPSEQLLDGLLDLDEAHLPTRLSQHQPDGIRDRAKLPFPTLGAGWPPRWGYPAPVLPAQELELGRQIIVGKGLNQLYWKGTETGLFVYERAGADW